MYNAFEKTKEINKFKLVVIPSRRELFERFGRSTSAKPQYSIGASDEVVPPTRSNNTIDQLHEVQNMLNDIDKNKH